MSVIIGYSKDENDRNEEPITNVRGEDVLGLVSKNSYRNIIIPGDSVYNLQLAKEQRERDTTAREKVRVYSPAYTKTPSGVTKVYQDSTNNCVLWAMRQAGISGRTVGNGGRLGINSQTVKIGTVGVERGIIHAVYIKDIQGDNIIIQESNYIKGWITQRILKRSDFLGFIE